jgi:mannan endo-1,4-beta-mannosidase
MSSIRLEALMVACFSSVVWAAPGAAPPSFEHFVSRDGDALEDGNGEFRFISFNIPNLHYVEDDMRFEQGLPFRLPDAFEIDDALATIEQMGGQVVRMYALSVKKADDPPGLPRHILGPGQLNEEALAVLDQVVAAAGRHRVRLILPFVDQWSWWGGLAELAGFRGKKLEAIWTDPELIEDYKKIIASVVSRVNTATGIRYRDDKTILAWETGNELGSPDSWTRIMAAHIKSLDSNHLVIDGAMRKTVSQASLEDPNIDFVQTHHYDKDPRDMLEGILRNRELSRGRKPYHVGEFGFLGTEALRAVMDTVIDQKIAGALLWSLRYRSRDGGFYWHHEPAGGDYFKAYHWPGFEIGEYYDERRFLRIVREKAFEIRDLTPPSIPIPAPPRLLSVSDGAQMTWQGSVGATCYDVARAEAAEGPWTVAGEGVSDAQVQYRPLFSDESARPGKTYYYRVMARNPAGASPPSNVVGPARITHRTLVDELWNDSRIFLKQGKLEFRQNEARKFKEDCHRLSGESGSAIVYHAKDGIRAVKVFLFSQSERPGISVSFSDDCRKFEAAEIDVARTVTYGESTYGFWKALLCSARAGGKDRGYVKIDFQGNSQISRVEIDHGHVE